MYINNVNRLSGLNGYLVTQNGLSPAQKQWLTQYTSNIKATDNTPDGTVVFDGKLVINYSEPNNFIQASVNLATNYTRIGQYTSSNGGTFNIYQDNKTKLQYIDMGNVAPVLVRIIQAVEPPRSGTPPTTGGNTTQTTEPDCPCDCSKQIVAEQIYINPTRTDSTDTPVKIKVQKRVCTSKDNEKKYIFDCNTSLEEINRQLNSGLNGLADCPCDCIDQLVEQTYYISSKPMTGSIPFTVNTEKIVCNDTNEILNKKVDCEELKASLRARGYTTLADKFDCMLSNGGLRDAISDDNIFTKNDYLIPKLTATFVGIFAISRYLMK